MKNNSHINVVNPFEEMHIWMKNIISELSLYTDRAMGSSVTFDVPPPHIAADYALPVFAMSEVANQSPTLVAERIVDHCSKDSFPLVKKIYTVGPYVNIEVDKELYCKRALDYIEQRGDLFGVEKKKHPQSILLNYPDTNLRVSLVGQAIGKSYEYAGDNVSHDEFNIDNEELILIGREVIADALKYGAAEYVSNTKAVISLPTDTSSPSILQKNDTSLTKHTLQLAHCKKNFSAGAEISNLIYLFPVEHTEIVESLIISAKRLKYIPQNVAVSTVPIAQTEILGALSQEDKAVCYSILKTSSDKKALVDENSFLAYARLVNLMFQPRQEGPVDKIEAFPLAQTLMAFPITVDGVRRFNKPDHLCLYLEKVADLFSKLSVKDEKLTNAVATVLRSGLRLLLS